MDEVGEAVTMSDWTNAYETMKKDLDLDNDAIGVFAVNLKFNMDDFQNTATEALTGGGDDKKCDLGRGLIMPQA